MSLFKRRQPQLMMKFMSYDLLTNVVSLSNGYILRLVAAILEELHSDF